MAVCVCYTGVVGESCIERAGVMSQRRVASKAVGPPKLYASMRCVAGLYVEVTRSGLV